MKPLKVLLYKISKIIVKVACALYLLIGIVVFTFGFSGLLWSNTAYTCLKAGSYMIASFIAIGSATMGLIGAFEDNFCMLLAYGIILTVSLTVRTITTIVMLHLAASSSNEHDVDRSHIEVPSLISGLPGTSSLFIEMIYAIIEMVLSLSAFTLASIISETQQFEHLNSKFYHHKCSDKELILFHDADVI